MLQDFEQSKPENISINISKKKFHKMFLMIICKKQMFSVVFDSTRNGIPSSQKEIYGITKNEWKHWRCFC